MLELLRPSPCILGGQHDSSHPNTDFQKTKSKPLNIYVYLHGTKKPKVKKGSAWQTSMIHPAHGHWRELSKCNGHGSTLA